MSRVSSYQKQKLKIAELEKKLMLHAQDIGVLLKGTPGSIEYEMVRCRWQFKIDMANAHWAGTPTFMKDYKKRATFSPCCGGTYYNVIAEDSSWSGFLCSHCRKTFEPGKEIGYDEAIQKFSH